MKKTLVLILILVKTGFVFTQDCSPTFKEVFDFAAGDFFKYDSVSVIRPGFSSLDGRSSISTECYIITGKIEKGDTLSYIRKGIDDKLGLRTYLHTEHIDTLFHVTYLINDTLKYIDSKNHFLNKCAGAMLDVTAFTREWSVKSMYYTSVQIEQNDSMLIKKVGGQNNFYIIDSTGSIIDTLPWLGHGFKLGIGSSYGKGIGLIHEYLSDLSTYEYSNAKTLIGYHKVTNPLVLLNAEITNGDTVKISQGSKVILRANKDSNLNYQWFKNGQAIPGATSDTFEVSDSGNYQVFVKKGSYELNFSKVCVVKVHRLVNEGLVAWYPFNGNANDESGNGHDGIVHGATLASNRFGNDNNAYNFNGVDNYIELSNTASLNMFSGLSLVAWVNFTDNNGSSIISKHINYYFNGFTMSANNNNVNFALNNGQHIISTSETYNDGNWHLFVGTYDGMSMSIYVDGVLKKSDTAEYAIGNNMNIRIGSDSILSFFNGRIDDVRLYDRALNMHEINALFNESNVNLNSGLVAWYPFNGNANDESGNGNNPVSNDATLTTDRFGNENAAYSFAGQFTRIIIPNDSTLNFRNDFSIGCWIKTNSVKNDLCILHKAVYGVWTGYMLNLNWTNPGYCHIPGHLTSYVASAADQDACSDDVVNTDRWVFVVSSYNDSLNETKLYIDGQLQGDIGARTGPVANDSSLIIGYNFEGLIDDIRLYNRVLSEGEIQALYYGNSYSIKVNSDSIANLGSVIEIPVSTSYVLSTDSIISYQFDLAYDSTMLEYFDCSISSTLAESGTIIVSHEIAGLLHVGYISTVALYGTGTIAKLKFRVTGQGNSPLIISDFLYNTDTVRRITNGFVNAVRFGDVDNSGSVQAYDAALTLQNSAGLDPLPSTDPIPWEKWRTASADVDGVPGISANDASFILQKSVGLIAQFPAEDTTDGFVTEMADVDLQVENNEIVFYSSGRLFGLNINAYNSVNVLGTPVISEASMIQAFNDDNGNYKIALATANPPAENTAFMKIPVKQTGKVTFDMIINSISKSVVIDLPTGVTDHNIEVIRIYPNPANNKLIIGGLKGPTIANIYTVNGELMQTHYLSKSTEVIGIDNFPKGLYIIKLNCNKQILVKRFVKL